VVLGFSTLLASCGREERKEERRGKERGEIERERAASNPYFVISMSSSRRRPLAVWLWC